MRFFRRSALLRLVVLPFTLAFWVSACTSMQVLQPPLERSMAAEQPSAVTVTLDDGREFELAQPVVSNDSIAGFDPDSWDAARRVHVERLAVPLDNVVIVEHPKFSLGKTLGRTGLVIVGLGVVLFIGDCLEGETGWDYC